MQFFYYKLLYKDFLYVNLLINWKSAIKVTLANVHAFFIRMVNCFIEAQHSYLFSKNEPQTFLVHGLNDISI